jgi:hypothetical protein
MRDAEVAAVTVTWAATVLAISPTTYEGGVKSFEVLSIRFASSGNSLQAIAENRTAITKNFATWLGKCKITG